MSDRIVKNICETLERPVIAHEKVQIAFKQPN
jgi:hypothetical protein